MPPLLWRCASSTPHQGCGSCAPARCHSTSTARSSSSSRRWLSPTRSSCSPAGPLRNARARGGERGRGRRARLVPISRRSAAGDRARRGANQDAVRRGDHPPARRPVPRPERPDQPQARTPPITQVDHPMELRPPVPRRPTRPVGTGHLRRRRTPLPAVEFVLEALDVPAAAAIDVVGRLASRSLVIVDDHDAARSVTADRAGPGSARFGTGCWTASGRSRSKP